MATALWSTAGPLRQQDSSHAAHPMVRTHELISLTRHDRPAPAYACHDCLSWLSSFTDSWANSARLPCSLCARLLAFILPVCSDQTFDSCPSPIDRKYTLGRIGPAALRRDGSIKSWRPLQAYQTADGGKGNKLGAQYTTEADGVFGCFSERTACHPLRSIPMGMYKQLPL